MKLDPSLRKLLSFGLIGLGAPALISSVVGVVSAYQLAEPSDDVTPADYAGFYALMFLVGLAMVVFGFKLRPKKTPGS